MPRQEIINHPIQFTLKVGKLHSGLLSSEGGNQVHQRRGKSIVGLQSTRLQLASHVVHALGVVALLDDRRHKGRKLRLLPALLIGELSVHKIQTVECMGLLNAAVHVDAAVTAGIALNHGRRVDNGQLGCVGIHADVVSGHNAYDREQ